MRLYTDKPPYIFKFNLPEKITHGRQNTVYNPATERFEVPEEVANLSKSQAFGQIEQVSAEIELSHLESGAGEAGLQPLIDDEESKLADIRNMKAMGEL